MTEVDGIMPEATTPQSGPTTYSHTTDGQPPTTTTSSNYNIEAGNASAQQPPKEEQPVQLKDQQQQNGLNKDVSIRVSNTETHDDEQMEVDGAETEGDDSQMTASSTTENGIGGGADGCGVGVSVDGAVAAGGEDSKMSTCEEDGNTNTSSIVGNKDRQNNEESRDDLLPTAMTPATTNSKENSTDFCNDELQNSSNTCTTDKSAGGGGGGASAAGAGGESDADADADADDTRKSQSTPPGEPKDSSNAASESLERPATVDSNTDSVGELEAAGDVTTSSQDEKEVVQSKTSPKDDAPSDDSRSAEAPEPMDTSLSADPLSIGDDMQQTEVPNKTNGVPKDSDAASGIVDLDDDDTDDDVQAISKPTDATDGSETVDLSEGNAGAVRKTKSVCSDSDGAVVIASDSDTENVTTSKSKSSNNADEAQIIDVDDDDCVVIEDDTPAPRPTSNDLTKRKSLAANSPLGGHSDDSQPPSKRPRSSVGPSTPVGQISIKDARSLMPHDSPAVVNAAAVAATKKVAETNIYPVNITPAAAIQSPLTAGGPPKLVPVMGAASVSIAGSPIANTTSLSGLSATTSNTSNLLPGLTDDMFVLEAPSFIVPYIYEKPPADNLKDIVKEIEEKYKLSKEDLAEADKPAEFDMMTEQNKEDKDEKGSKKKKRRRGGEDIDESWSEGTDDDEDYEEDDDSEPGVRTKVLIKEASDDMPALKGAIKPAAALVQSPSTAAQNVTAPAKPGQENYFESPLGKFFMDIGVGLVQEFVQSDLIRLQKRKMRKSLGKNITDFERAIAALSGNLEASRKKNEPFKFTMKRCEFCNFKTESALSMANHYETPHMNGALYKCNFCAFEIRNATEIVYHMEAIHNIKARLIKPLPYHQCPNCGFEDNGKAKMGRHQPVCAKKFRPEINLAPPADWEAPAKIPRIKPRHGLVGTATAYQAMAAQAAAQKAALASIQQQQNAVAQARNMQAALAAHNAANKLRGRSPGLTAQKAGVGPVPTGPILRGPAPIRSQMATNIVQPNNYQVQKQQQGGKLLKAANAFVKKTLSGQPSISITPLPRQNAAQTGGVSPSTSKFNTAAGMKPGLSPIGLAGSNNSKAQFVICEICDGYIKDLEQLRNHMQWMHKVKIHPKMIYNRPPLNCQKCQFRFFTDQGLERHLLGSHGLVTSSMQEAANKGKDAGRCPVCGRMYQWKLLNHVSRDHHMTLKPAHLSYKCTVCTATFGMYKQFETHVYTAHSTVAKKAMDGKKNAAAAAVSGSGAGGSALSLSGGRSSLTGMNDSLLKPLKINDEITIIPQPAAKPRITNMESHIID